jgi:hypothetical protein
MINVTTLVRQWIYCSNDLWSRWFASTESGAHQFSDVELALLSAMVLERGDLSRMGVTVENFFERLLVIYPNSINEQTRQFCVVQNSGNIFCKPQIVSMPSGSKFKVESIDTIGTMDDGRPYVEVEFGNGYLLESPDSIEFAIE